MMALHCSLLSLTYGTPITAEMQQSNLTRCKIFYRKLTNCNIFAHFIYLFILNLVSLLICSVIFFFLSNMPFTWATQPEFPSPMLFPLHFHFVALNPRHTLYELSRGCVISLSKKKVKINIIQGKMWDTTLDTLTGRCFYQGSGFVRQWNDPT